MDALLAESVGLFWRQGYQTTSIRDVAKVANLTTGTLYNEFGSKEALYAATLEHYFAQVIKPRVDTILLAEHPAFLKANTLDTGLSRIHYFLVSSVHGLPTSVAYQACLLINSKNELGIGDTPIHHVIDKANRYITNAIKKVLIAIDSKKEAPPTVALQSKLLQVNVFMTGLLMTAKHIKDTRTLIPTVDAFIQQLEHSHNLKIEE
ncbi:TetR/AcrR family transcriptional regulator [Pseudomonas sp. HK3]